MVLSSEETCAWTTSAGAGTQHALHAGDLLRVEERAGTKSKRDRTASETPDAEQPPPLAISLLPGVDVALAGDSAIVLKTLRFDKLAEDVTAREATISWQGGQLFCALSDPPGTVPAHLRITTAGGMEVLAGPGSLCGFWNDPTTGQVRILCARGFVVVAEERLAAGRYRDLSPTGHLELEQLAASDGVAQRQVAALRAVERILLRLEARRQDAPPPWWR
ncbi:MAG: hypothetical protein JO295_06565 [Verrucomicrobia bacterium]|nr:hypothetical protein [Verrucomicrobiota bacterium]